MQRRRLPWRWTLFPACLLAFVLLLSQTLGLLHGIVHAPSIVTGHAVYGAHEVTHEPHATALAGPDAGGFLTRLFSGHSTDEAVPDCRLYDQSSHFDGMAGLPVLALPLVLAPFVFSVLTGLAVARWHALFQARGPPSVR